MVTTTGSRSSPMTEEQPTLTYAALAVTLELSRLRSTLLVGTALVSRFPEEEDWWGLTQEPEYVESVNSLAEVLSDIQADVSTDDGATPDAIAAAAERHHQRALEAVEVLAERLGVPAEDVLTVLISL